MKAIAGEIRTSEEAHIPQPLVLPSASQFGKNTSLRSHPSSDQAMTWVYLDTSIYNCSFDIMSGYIDPINVGLAISKAFFISGTSPISSGTW
ncbi:MAG: hypothetical protein AB4426_09050 [Xenococcaceae cyanobacterium]